MPENSPPRVYFTYLLEKKTARQTIGRKMFEPNATWSELFATTRKELNAAAFEDLQKAGEEAVVKAIDFAVSEGKVAGVSAGAAHIWLLKAEVAVVGKCEEATVRVAADNFYQDYRKLREAGSPHENAWDEVMERLAGEGLMNNLNKLLSSRSRNDFRCGGYILRHRAIFFTSD